ncbi:U6 snRNA phosphodiesterase Usb1 [Usnea florida]
MALVEYSDSEGSDSPPPEQTLRTIQESRAIKRKHSPTSDSTLPSLPDSFHDLYASSARVSNQDDPTLHNGRQRLKPHIEGNWPTHVYIEWFPSTESSSRLNAILTTLSNAQCPQEHQLHSLLRSGLGAELPLHISLSRPIVLLAHQRQSFVDALTRAISKTNSNPFTVTVKGLEWVANYENTRWFLVLKLEKPPQDDLNKLLQFSNQNVTAFGQPPLYTDSLQPLPDAQSRKRQAGNRGRSKEMTGAAASSFMNSSGSISYPDVSSSFHISIGWTLDAPTQDLRERLNSTDIDLQGITIDINTVKVKIGNGITAISLANKIETTNRIIEK